MTVTDTTDIYFSVDSPSRRASTASILLVHLSDYKDLGKLRRDRLMIQEK